MRQRHFIIALILGIAAFFVYRGMAAPGMLPGDAGEFQFTIPNAGLSHPTGYPFYHLSGWLWTRLYLANPAQGANHFSALWAAVAVGLFYLLAYAMLRRLLDRLHWRRGAGWLAFLVALVFAGNPTFWAEATRAEVYTLMAAFTAALLGLTLVAGAETERGWGRGSWRAFLPWLAFGMGLALTHHLTAILLFPAIAFYLLLTRPAAFRPTALWRLAIIFLAPLLLYLYVPLRASASPWLTVQLTPDHALQLFDNSLGGVVRYILGVGFAPALRDPAQALEQVPAAANLFLQHFGWPGLMLILLGLVALLLEEQIALLLLTLLGFLPLTIFNLFYGIDDIAAFYIPSYLIATLWLGLGLAYGVELLSRLMGSRVRDVALLAMVAVAAIPVVQFRAFRPAFDRSLAVDTAYRWSQILAQDLPENSILISNDRDEITPMLYKQYVEGQALGMTGLFPLISPEPAWQDLNATLASALKTGRPVFLIKPMPGVEVRYPNEDAGAGLRRVLGAVQAPEPSFEYPYSESLRWLNIEWEGAPRAGDNLNVGVYWRVLATPTRNWHSFLQLLDSTGEKVAQANDHRPGGDYLPPTLWRPGDVIRDAFILPLPVDLPSGQYALVAGFYDPTTGERMTDPLPLAQVQVE
ncbi:MAG: DUF2723 domain-containing protein [Chloroflexi bacterium]|nr:DUF2723 domain-containing protein [Chloroflexota bacterium]